MDIKDSTSVFALYFDETPEIIKKHDLSRGDDDFREVYIVQGKERKLVIKLASNSFTDDARIIGCAKLIDAYNELGIYCPRMVKNKNGELYHKHTENGRDFYIYAEEFAIYPIAEDLGSDKFKLPDGTFSYNDDMMISLGRVAAAHLDLMECRSSYCLLEPLCTPDTVDEQTECAELFFSYIYENLPEFKAECDELKALFYKIKGELEAVYHTLPCSCFQGDLNDSNVLIDEDGRFCGLIDFNLAGKEPVMNYPIREALWQALYCEDYEDGYFTVDEYIARDEKNMKQFMHNLRLIGKEYTFSEAERAVFLTVFHYMYSFWWRENYKIKEIASNKNKVAAYLGFLKFRMTRDDICLS